MSKKIILKNISKKYSTNANIKVLNELNFSFEQGKIYSLVGPSGSGKSTLLNLLSLIDTPSAGSIEILNNKINFKEKIKNDTIRSEKIGIIYQDKNLLSDFTALENVYLPMLLLTNDKYKSIILISICSIFITIIVSIYPAAKASKIDTVKTLKYE